MRKLAAVGALLFTGLAGLASLASAGTTTYTLSNGLLAGIEANCTQVIFSFNGSDCGYANKRTSLNGWESPPQAPGFYRKDGGVWETSLAYQGNQASLSPPDPNFYDVPVTGTLVIDDKGTPGDPTDDEISFNWTIGAAVHNILTGANGRALIEKWDSVTEVMAATQVNATITAANGAGGVDYFITTQTPFPTRLSHAARPADSNPAYVPAGLFPSPYAPGSLGDPAVPVGTGPYYDAPSPTGIERTTVLGGNPGGSTTASFTNYDCIDTGNSIKAAPNTGTTPTGSDCQASPLAWGAPLWPGTIIAPGTTFGQNPGWDNVILKVSTDATGAITSAIAYYTREFRIVGLGPPGAPAPTPNSWQGGVVTFTAPAPATAAADAFEVAKDSSGNLLDVAANDSGFSNPVTLSVTVPPNNGGTAVQSGSPGNLSAVRISYTPAASFVGTETFTYQITDGTNTKTAVVTVTVLDVGANADTATTKKNTPVVINVLANDVGFVDPVTLSIATPPAHGSTAILGTNPGAQAGITVRYTPNNGYAGPDSFVYQVVDANNFTKSATVSITVTNQTPTANNVTVTTGEDVPKLVDLAAIAGNTTGDAPATYAVSNALNGTTSTVSGSSVTFTPTQYFDGSASFDYSITDADGDVANGTVTVTVGPKKVPTAAGATLTVQQDTAGDATAAITLGSGAVGLHTTSITVAAANGTCTTGASPASATSVVVHYVPTAGYSGTDSCTYQVKDADNDTAIGVISVTVEKNQLVVTLPGGGSALDPVTLGLLALGVPVVLRRRRRHDA